MSGKMMMKPSAWADSGEDDDQADEREDPRERVAEEQQRAAMPATISATPASKQKPTMKPDDEHRSTSAIMFVATSASVRPASTAERAIGSERKRSIRPLLQVLGEPERGGEAAEGDRLDDDPGHQEVDVVVARAC